MREYCDSYMTRRCFPNRRDISNIRRNNHTVLFFNKFNPFVSVYFAKSEEYMLRALMFFGELASERLTIRKLLIAVNNSVWVLLSFQRANIFFARFLTILS